MAVCFDVNAMPNGHDKQSNRLNHFRLDLAYFNVESGRSAHRKVET